jgi:hypothetical protein
MLGKARGLVTVNELELSQELTPVLFTAMGRYVYDNSLPQSAPPQYVQTVGGKSIANILGALRAQMSANSFDSGRIQYSSTFYDATTATANCTNVYSDYARNMNLDEMTQVINGGYFGMPYLPTVTSGLVCNGSIYNGGNPYMFQSPIYSTQPNIVDSHMYPQVVGTTNTDAMIQQVAALDYGDVPHYLGVAGLQAASIMIGETYGGKINALFNPYVNAYCWLGSYLSPSGAPNDNVAGFNNEGVSTPLSSYTVTFRPWMELEDPQGGCYGYGSGPGTSGNYQTVNYLGQGPYTPTHN